jgi:GAF domain-containing protein
MTDDAKSSAWTQVKELQLILQINQILDSSVDLSEILEPVLRTIVEHTGMIRGAVALRDRGRPRWPSKRPTVDAQSAGPGGRYKIGEESRARWL